MRIRRTFDQPPRRPLVILLAVACLVLMVLDARSGSSSPINPLRAAVGTVVGPVEDVSAAAVRPFAKIGQAFHDNSSLRHQVASLSAENSRLRSQSELTPMQRKRLDEYSALTRTAHQTGYSLVAAQVIGIGPSQSFDRTVTINAGTTSGVHADQTVLNGDGLVGRVVNVTPTTATVLLIVDGSSVVGGRLGSNMEIGDVRGTGSMAGHGSLDMDMVNPQLTPARGDVVVTWGSNGGPYVAGVPIGKVTQVMSNPRQLTKRAVITPYADFSSLDIVGVVVPKGTHGDRPVIKAGGKR